MNVDIFFGIPYAQPPVGNLRFEKTVPLIQNETQTIYALEQPKVCVQHHRLDNWTWDWYQYSEDCLYLNLFSPHRIEGQVENLLPILVLIYTGGFETQSMRRYKDFEDIGRKYLSKGILVIAVQFRIGFLGFSSIGNPHQQLDGNFGYWDIAEALNWIKLNVKSFGGDPGRITLFGYSAGSTAVTTLGISPHTRDLFQQSIQMSGSIFTSRAANDRVISVSNHLFTELGCISSTTEQLKECLKTKDIEEYFDAMDIIGSTIPDVNYDIFGPIMDNDFLPKGFTELINETNPKPTILGITEMDPLGYYVELLSFLKLTWLGRSYDQQVLILGNNSLRHLGIPKNELNEFGINQFKTYLRQKIIKKENFGDFTEKVVEHIFNFYLNYDKPEKLDNWFYLERMVYVVSSITDDLWAFFFLL
uniref:Carboxylic ester hydrolase n=1 Tax=Meloidogyne incognita TaxID=6306 RepID=A0A914KW32_MELIC